MMRFSSIGSGSAGNGLLVQSRDTTLLLDCGFGLRDAIYRLQRASIAPESLNGILITHEHDDHAGGVFKLANKFGIPVWLTHGTLTMVERLMPKQRGFELHIIDSHTPFTIRDLAINPFPVPHDAREPVQYTFHDGDRKLGVLTDTGTSTPHIEAMLSGCHGLVLECNHDLDMLMNGPYAWPLKKRVSGRLGHLDNTTSASILANLDLSHLQHLLAAHLSAKNNHPDLVIDCLSSALNCERDWISIADQELGFDWRDIR